MKKSLTTKIKKVALKGIGLLSLCAALIIFTLPAANAATAGFENEPVIAGSCTAAGVFGDILCGLTVAIQSFTLGALYAIGKLFAIILSGITSATIWAIGDLGINITTHPSVSLGFSISLSVANTVFIVAMIAIAFATVLRWHEYEAKKLLPKLVITALLVNFSLLAAGVLLDVSNVFTTYFMTRDSVTAKGIGDALSPQLFSIPVVYGGGGFQNDEEIFESLEKNYSPLMDDMSGSIGAWDSRLARWRGTKELVIYDFGYGRGQEARAAFERDLRNRNPDLLRRLKANASRTGEYVGKETDVGVIWDQFLDLLPKVIFSVFMTFVAMLTMVAMFIMALIRNIWIVVLLIAMPVAWALRVLPKFEQYWQKWWEKFLNWGIVYLPTLSFFLYVAVQTSIETRGRLSVNELPEAGTATIDFLGIRANGGTGPTVLDSMIVTLIIIGIMVAGLKIAQAMGASGAGFFANLAPKGMRKIGMGLLKGTTATAGALAGGVAGLGFGGLRSLARKVAPSEKYKEYQDLIAIAEAEGDQAEVKKLKKAMGTFGSAFKGGAFFGGATGLGRDELNLYGKATGFLGEKLARFSFIPGVGAASEFFSKTSAAQREAIGRAKKEFDGRDEATRKNLYKAAVFKSVAHQAAALQAAKENHDHLPDELASKLADAVATLYPGVDRSKIDLLKEVAGHNPFGARGITGETAQAVIKRADAEMGRSWDMSHWTASQRKEALGIMSDALKRAVASKNDFNRDLMLRHSIERLGDISERMSDEQKRTNTLMLSDFAAVREGRETKEVMDRLEGHLETLAGKENEKLRESFEAGQKTALRFGQDVARVVTGVKSKSEHGHHGNLSDFEIRNMAKKAASAFFSALTAKSGGGSSGGAKKVADSHAGDGHHGQ